MTPAMLLVAGAGLGLLHAAHCAGMCGVFAVHAARRRGGFPAYGLGKTTTYVLIGALVGAAGAVVHTWAHPYVPVFGIVVGLVLVVGGWRLLRPGSGAVTDPLVRSLGRVVGDLTGRELPGGRYTLGALTGALPCGAVALALLQASVAGDAVRGAGLMAAFGVGTLPSLLGVALLAKPARARFSPATLARAGAAAVMLAGTITVVRSALPLFSDAASCCPTG